MAPSRHAWFPAVCAATVLGASPASGWAADDVVEAQPYRYEELRVGYSSAPAPDVRQQKPVDNSWNEGDSRGDLFTITYLRGCAPTTGYLGTAWAVRFSLGSYNLGDEGKSYDLVQPIVDFAYGWQYGIVETDSIRGFGELLPYVGLGTSHMQILDKARFAPALAAGVRAGAYLTERHWLAGLTASYVYSYSRLAFTADGEKQAFDLTANGFTFGGEFGYRF